MLIINLTQFLDRNELTLPRLFVLPFTGTPGNYLSSR
jgi:hypothetical protein